MFVAGLRFTNLHNLVIFFFPVLIVTAIYNYCLLNYGNGKEVSICYVIVESK